MPLFGAHLSIAGGHVNAIHEATRLGMDALQIFTASPSQWAAKPITDDQSREFRDAAKESKLGFIVVHDSYLINLAASDQALFLKSIHAFTQEMERTASLGIGDLVMHPGAHLKSSEEDGIQRVTEALNECIRRTRGLKVRVLIETTAGQGTTLGRTFEQIARILDGLSEPERFGVCVDTCHIFAAGYALGTQTEYDATFQQFDDLIGLERIACFHVNDSVKGLGSRVDRHAGIGLGLIGESAFQFLVNDQRFTDRPMILETPKEQDGTEMDPVNLAKLRGYIKKPRKKPSG